MGKTPKNFIELSKSQMKQAARIIKKLISNQRSSSDLLADTNEPINLTIEVCQIPEIPTLRCVAIPLPHSIYSKTFGSQVFLITKDPQREWREKLDALDLKDLPLSKVQSISKLGKNFMRFKDRRQLLKDYDLFLADVRVFNMLPERLGKYFYSKKKIPALLSLDEDPAKAIRDAIHSTFLVSCKGPIFTLKVGRASMTTSQILDNIHAVLDAMPNVVPGLMPEHIRRVDIKGTSTLALPVYNHLNPEEIAAYRAL